MAYGPNVYDTQKMKSEQICDADQQTCGDALTVNQAATDRPYPENVIVGLRSSAIAHQAETRKIQRIARILERHPEFLEFLEGNKFAGRQPDRSWR